MNILANIRLWCVVGIVIGALSVRCRTSAVWSPSMHQYITNLQQDLFSYGPCIGIEIDKEIGIWPAKIFLQFPFIKVLYHDKCIPFWAISWESNVWFRLLWHIRNDTVIDIRNILWDHNCKLIRLCAQTFILMAHSLHHCVYATSCRGMKESWFFFWQEQLCFSNISSMSPYAIFECLRWVPWHWESNTEPSWHMTDGTGVSFRPDLTNLTMHLSYIPQ